MCVRHNFRRISFILAARHRNHQKGQKNRTSMMSHKTHVYVLPGPHLFFRNACTKLGSLRFSQFSGCWLILSVYILMSFDSPFVEFGNFVITLMLSSSKNMRLKVSVCHYNSIYNNTWTKQVKQLSNRRQTHWSKCQKHFYVTHR
jgi:hypothetical protein